MQLLLSVLTAGRLEGLFGSSRCPTERMGAAWGSTGVFPGRARPPVLLQQKASPGGLWCSSPAGCAPGWSPCSSQAGSCCGWGQQGQRCCQSTAALA